ncbi:MAG: hypothetical protein ACR2FM_01795 [Candidatus Saccharimonadales bacterium]
MNILRNFASWISLHLVGVCFLLTANVFALFGVLNANAIQEALRAENTYTKIVPSVIASARNDPKSAGQIPLNAPWVRTAADTAFPASDLEQKGDTVIASTFTWLEGKGDKPVFSLDFTENNARFSEEIGNNVTQQLSGLPACNVRNLPASFDVFNATCMPPGISAAQAGRTVSQQIANEGGFLKTPVISSDDFSLDALSGGATSQQNRSPFPQFDGLQSVYSQKTLLLWLLPLLTVAFMVIGLLLAQDRSKALRQITRSMVAGAIGLFVLGLLLTYGLKRLLDSTPSDALTRDVFSPVLLNLAGQLQIIYFIFTGVGIGLAVATYIASRKIKPEPKIL